MKGLRKSTTQECLYLDFSHQVEGCIFPLHTSVTLFLLSYCDCRAFKVCLVPSEESADLPLLKNVLSQDVALQVVSRRELPPIVQSCCLPAVLEGPDNFCRAGLAVILRHIIQKSSEADPSKKELLELLGFKKTCLKACAEVSQWTRLCELTIPSAIEAFLRDSSGPRAAIPTEMMLLERKLGEPVRVHNDDKLRRQKLKQQRAAGAGPALPPGKAEGPLRTQEPGGELEVSPQSLELQLAFSKLSVHQGPATPSREPAHIRKAGAAALPPLEHVFAEGLYFTLADIVLLPCVHQFLVLICRNLPEALVEFPLLAAWYRRIQEVPRVREAASRCGIHFLHLPEPQATSAELRPQPAEAPAAEEQSAPSFVGGPRPTMTKLMVLTLPLLACPPEVSCEDAAACLGPACHHSWSSSWWQHLLVALLPQS